MDEIQKSGATLSVLDDLAAQARMFTQQMVMSGIQLGRVLCEAKKLVRHGEWKGWLTENAPIGERMAQSLMAAWKRFGQNAAYAQMETSKLVRILALPDGMEDAFAKDNDLPAMSAREIESAVREAKQGIAPREEREGEVSQDPENAPADGISEEVSQRILQLQTDRDRYHAEMQRLGAQGTEILKEKQELREKLERIERDNKEKSDLLETMQSAVDDAQTRLSEYESREARGDVDRVVSGVLTSVEFATAVRDFMSVVLVLPHMYSALARSDEQERSAFDANLRMIEEWAEAARRAVDSVDGAFVEDAL